MELMVAMGIECSVGKNYVTAEKNVSTLNIIVSSLNT